MSSGKVVLCYFFLATCSLSLGNELPTVKTPLGQLRGSLLRSRSGREYWAFTGVPFAKPPIGTRRFKAPVAVEPWPGVLEASRPASPLCLQSASRGVKGQEDCLYLNVYTPNLNGSLPVLVYFHGGGWRVGSPGPASVSRFFMDQDVVLVMSNYRLGPFGFLSTEDAEIPGNMGLKDMAAALEWTEENIASFGGDPASLTASGLSAGAASVHYLCSALRTRGLLKGCISESGVGGSFWSLAKPGTARSNAYKVANALGCFGSGLLQCLQTKDPLEILRTERLLKFWTNEPLIIYGPVLERHKSEEEEAFLSEWPTDSGFPWLTGITSSEGKLKSGSLSLFFPNKSTEEEFYSQKEMLLIKMLNLNESSRESARKVYERFFTRNTFLEGMEKLYSEAYFVHPVLKELKAHKGPKYFYVFDYTEGPTFWEVYTKKTPKFTGPGAAHGDSSFFFFQMDDVELKPKQVQLSKDLIKFWINFAKYQKPDTQEKPLWRQFGALDNSYLYIGNSGFSQKNYENVEEILNFWKQIY